MKKIFTFLAASLLSVSLGWAKSDYCHVTSEGDTKDFVKSISDEDNFFMHGTILIYVFSNPDWHFAEDGQEVFEGEGVEFQVRFYPKSQENWCGTYSVNDEDKPLSAWVSSRVDGEMIDLGAQSGTIQISLSADEKHYDMHYNLMVESPDSESEELNNIKGIIHGICAEDIVLGVEKVQSDKVQTKKVLRDSHLFIECHGKTYNALGAEVR